MRSKLVRALSAADDMLEVVLVLGFKVVRKTWLPVATLGLLTFGAMQSLESRKAPPPPLPDFQVVSHSCCIDTHRAQIRFEGVEYPVRPGSVVPAQDPKLVITDIGDGVVRALTVGSWTPLSERLPLRARPMDRDPVTVVAIAGEHPEYIAVIEFQEETYIVQPGNKIPCDHNPQLEVAHVGADRVSYYRLDTRERQTARLPVADLDGLDVPEI